MSKISAYSTAGRQIVPTATRVCLCIYLYVDYGSKIAGFNKCDATREIDINNHLCTMSVQINLLKTAFILIS